MRYPSEFPSERQNFAEMRVFEALGKLGDQFDIFYNKGFARKHPKEASVYEIDFLVFDLRNEKLNHVFVIEVKGGSMAFSSKTNRWKSSGHYVELAPDQQAMGYVKNIIARYYYTLAKKVPVTWLLWFPDGVKTKKEYFPTQLSVWRVLDQYALNDPLEYLDTAIKNQDFEGFSGADLEEYEEKIKRELTQSFNMAINLQALLNQMQRSFELLEVQQKIFFSSLLGISRLSIEGYAGSGKSFLAKCAATEFSSIGKKCLFICFNRFLKHQVMKALPQDVHVDTVLNFMGEYIDRKDSGWIKNYKPQDQRSLENDIPQKFNHLLKASPVHPDDRYGAIIIDEGQDMNKTWIKLLLRFLKKGGQVLVFFDPKQNIFNRDFDLPSSENWTPITLTYNHRNAKSINQFINETLQLDIESGSVPEGLPVKIKTYQEGNLLSELDKILLQLIKIQNVRTNQITVLVDGSTKDWDLAISELSSGLQLKWLVPGEERKDGEISITSVNHFKGSESEIVILILKEPLTPITNHNLRYTQMSRAKGGLWILERN